MRCDTRTVRHQLDFTKAFHFNVNRSHFTANFREIEPDFNEIHFKLLKWIPEITRFHFNVNQGLITTPSRERSEAERSSR